MLVLHHCDNPPCVNPAHLYLGTHADNARDRKQRNRGVRGERVNTNVLTPGQVQQIRWLCASKQYRHRDIGTVYGITEAMVGIVDRGESWRWLAHNPLRPPSSIERQLRQARVDRTPTEAERVRANKRKGSKGSRNSSAKLTEAQVYEIRALAGAQSQQSIGDKYGISQSVVSAIQRRATWKHLPPT